jgi:hypothetical protein
MNIIRTVKFVRNGILLSFLIGIFGVIIWYLPYFAILVAVVGGGVALVSLSRDMFLKWFRSSPERVRQWQELLIMIGRLFSIAFSFALIIGVIAVWIRYPFEPIWEVPLAEITLKLIVDDLLGVLLFLATPGIVFYLTFKSALDDEHLYARRGKLTLWLALWVIVIVGVFYWLDPNSATEIVRKWRSDFYSWWSPNEKFVPSGLCLFSARRRA